MNSFLTLIAGAILPQAFAPFNRFPIAFISPAILLAVWLRSRPFLAFWQGSLFGLGFFGVGVSWVYLSIHHFSNHNVLLAIVITILFVFILSLFIALQGFFFLYFLEKKEQP